VKEKEIVIYFKNGNKAKFKLSKVIFGGGCANPSDVFNKLDGKIFVNVDTVCFIREWEDEPLNARDDD